MQNAMEVGFPYIVAACVGLCFGALIAGAAIFVTHTGTASAVGWVHAPPAAPKR